MPQITYPDKAIGDLYRAVEANEVKAVVNAKMDRPNGLISGGAITIGSYGGSGTNNDIKVAAGDYFISPDFFVFPETPNAAPWLDVALCSGGLSRYVEIVGTTTGITRRDGPPSTIPSHPTIATNEVSLGWILVGDSVIEEPTSVVSGFIPYDEKDGEVYNSNTQGFGVGYKEGTNRGKVSFNGGDAVITTIESSHSSDTQKASVEVVADRDGDSAINWNILSTIRNVGAYLTTAAFQLYNVALNYAPSVTLASSTNPALGITFSNNVTITGTTTIAGFDNVAEGITRIVKFTGILQLTYNATSLILPSSANITTAVGDIAVFRSLGSGNWECISYTRKDGTALSGVGGGGNEITDSGTIATIILSSNYNDAYGNSSPPIGGVFNTTIPIGISEHDYYIEPIGTPDGLPRHKIECKKITSSLSLIRIPYLQ